MRKKITGLIIVLSVIMFLYGCGGKKTSQTMQEITSEEYTSEKYTQEETLSDIVEESTEYEEILDEAELEKIADGDIALSADELADYAVKTALMYDRKYGSVTYTLSLPKVPKSDDAYLYLFALECYEDGLNDKPVISQIKDKNCDISFPYEKEYLFMRFVPALLIDGEYMPVGKGIYLSNPEALAFNQKDYPDVKSKKGLLLDPTMLASNEFIDLGVKHAIYNIPLSHIVMGEKMVPGRSAYAYKYQGKKYYMDAEIVNAYDGLFTYLSNLNMCTTAIILNDWNKNCTDMIHPKARNQDSGAYYYMFNATDKKSVRQLEATACFLAERYSIGKYGTVHNWVIANEINQHNIWNYMDTDDIAYYTQEFEKAFRIFYQAVKSYHANAKVYFSIDHDWDSNVDGKKGSYFNAKELMETFNEAALMHGNYDWGIAIHPYPNPLTRVNYWSQEYDKTQDAPFITIMNLSVLTDFLKQKNFLDTKGKVRSISITELGFSSKSGEKLQAAAFAYCYFIIEANPYIEALILSRQTDAPEEIRQGLSFGLYEYDYSEKYIKDVFRLIDTKQSSEYVDFVLNILDAESLDEALEWAR